MWIGIQHFSDRPLPLSTDTEVLELLGSSEEKSSESKHENETVDKEVELCDRMSRDTSDTLECQILSVASCVALRIVEMVADFSLNRKWRGDLIHRWEEAFQLLQAMDNKLQVQVSERLDS
jgi:hypothetical protein